MEDSVIGCHGSRLPVHRLVLACHSAPLAALLAEQQRPECQAMGQKEAGEDKKEEEEKEEKEEKEEERGPMVLLDVTSWFPLASDREPVLDALRYIHGQELRLSVKRAGKVLRGIRTRFQEFGGLSSLRPSEAARRIPGRVAFEPRGAALVSGPGFDRMRGQSGRSLAGAAVCNRAARPCRAVRSHHALGPVALPRSQRRRARRASG